VEGLTCGDAVLASGATSCGRCDRCIAGQDNYCRTQVHMGTRMMSMKVRGIGLDGGLARYMSVPARDLVKLATLSPHQAAPLADAGATSYHAVMTARDELLPGTHCVVIGVGGLGSFAVQYLRILTGVAIIAIDPNPKRRERALALGAAAAFPSGDPAAAAVLAETKGQGAAVVLDFVGGNDSLALANNVVQPHGRIVVPGISMGTTPFGWGVTAPGCRLNLSLGFTISDLRGVVALAEAGRLDIGIQTFTFEQIETAYAALAAGELDGRAVIRFDE
jgi:propanol-preferring alcohol dehydrogenase